MKLNISQRTKSILAGVALFLLSGVLVMGIMRVVNLENVFPKPKATGLYCADGSSCPQGQTCGNSGYCESVSTGAKPTPSGGCDPDATDRYDCVNGSFCSNGQWVCNDTKCDQATFDSVRCENGAPKCSNGQWKCVDKVNPPGNNSNQGNKQCDPNENTKERNITIVKDSIEQENTMQKDTTEEDTAT